MTSKPKAKPRLSGRMLPIMHPDAAGIDIGAEEIFVSVPPDRDIDSVRRFDTFTRDLFALADWLRQCKIRSVAMESTGVYWIPLYQILVNARHVKNVPGRKSDVSDCQWIQYLHSVGLLKASFRPPDEICVLRSLWRHREGLVQMAAEHIQHMQKALSQMNLQLHHVLSDIVGVSGTAILDASWPENGIQPSSLTYAIGASAVHARQWRSLWKGTIVRSICSRFASPWQPIGSISN
ncbi:MAG: transposase [Terracidiphilus sp.]|jgi:hypothetical protein